MSGNRDVVITGLGVVSPIGIGRADFELSLREGRSGVAPIQQYDASALAVPYGGEIQDFQPKLYVKPRKSLKVMCREIQAGVASAALAVEDAGLDTQTLDNDRFGVVYGCPMFYSETAEMVDLFRQCQDEKGEFAAERYGSHFARQMQPLWMLKYLPNMTASHIGIAHNARGANNSVVMGDVSSTLAIIEAATVIQRGYCDVMLTGGSGNRLSLTGVVYRGDSNLSHHPSPQQASRPFDADRDGQVIGEGAGTLVLESRQHAEERNANILGSIVSFSSTHAGSDIRLGMVSAIERSIRTCLTKGGCESVGHVNTHGLSERLHDSHEAQAIVNALGSRTLATGIKSYFGNVGAASGVLELAASLVCQGEVPSTLNYERADPACAIRIDKQFQSAAGPEILKLNQAGTGQAVALLVKSGD